MTTPSPPPSTWPNMSSRAPYQDGPPPLTAELLDAAFALTVTVDANGNTDELNSIRIGPMGWVTGINDAVWVTSNAFYYTDGNWYSVNPSAASTAVVVNAAAMYIYRAQPTLSAVEWVAVTTISNNGIPIATNTGQLGVVTIDPNGSISINGQGIIKVAYGSVQNNYAANTAAESNDPRIVGAEQVVNKNAINGYCPLDNTAKIPWGNLPTGLEPGVVLNLQGPWNASTNTPTLVSSIGTQDYAYLVDVAGTINLDGINSWPVGSVAYFANGTWHQQPAETLTINCRSLLISDLYTEVTVTILTENGTTMVTETYNLVLLPTDNYVGITNETGAAISISPPITPVTGQEIQIKDEGANASPTASFIFNGVIDGNTNPVLIATPGGAVIILYTGAKWVQIV